MSAEQILIELRQQLSLRVSRPDEIRRLLEQAGIDLEGLSLVGAPELVWRRALDECRLQGVDALESLLVELLDRFPGHRGFEGALRGVMELEAPEPKAADGGGSLAEGVVRDPLGGTELLIQFAEARQARHVLVLQLRRYLDVLHEINRDRRSSGRMLAHEKRWKEAVREILELAHELEA